MASRRWFLISAASLTALSACAGKSSLRAAGGDRHTTTVSGSDPTPTTDGPTTPPDTTEPDPTTTPIGGEPTEPWNPGGTLDEEDFPFGIQTGDATPDGVITSIRTLYRLELRLVLARAAGDGWEELLEVGGLVAVREVVQVELVDLDPDTTYAVTFFAGPTRRSAVGRFRTALAPGASRVIRFGATSCLGGNLPWRSMSAIAARRLDFFALLGDTIYADDNPWGDLDHEASWDDALAVAGLRDLTASTSVIAVWDDHEVNNDWHWDDPGMPDLAFDAAEAFRRALPQRDGPGGSGFWRRLTWGDAVEVFALDCRGERVDGRYISPEQMAWLEEGLLASRARFKIILNSVPICDMDDVYFGIGAEDRWDGYPEQRAEILEHVTGHGITGVVWLSGDFHWGAVAHVDRPGDPHHGQWDVFCGPAGSSINPLAFLVREDDHYERVITRHNVVEFTADPEAGTLHVAFVGDDGAVFEEITLEP